MSRDIFLEEAFENLKYSTNMENILPLKTWLATRGNIITSLVDNNPVEAVDISAVTWKSAYCSDLEAKIFPSKASTVSSVSSSAAKFDRAAQDRVTYLTNLLKVFNQHQTVLYLAEAAAVGRPLSEMERVDTGRITQAIKSAIAQIHTNRLEALQSAQAPASHCQLVVDGTDLVSVFEQVICALTMEDTLIISCSVSEERLLPAYVLSSLLLSASPPPGLVSFIPHAEDNLVIPGMTHIRLMSSIGRIVDDTAISVMSYYGQSCAMILEGADLDIAAHCCLESLLYCSGTLSTSPHIVLVQEPVFAAFESLLVGDLLPGIQCENPLKMNCQLGPLPKVDMFNSLVSALETCAREKDGLVVPEDWMTCPGMPSCGLRAMMLTGVQTSTPFLQPIRPGPYLCLLPFRTVKEGVVMANRILNPRNTLLVWTEVIGQAMEIVGLVDYQHVGVNCSTLDFAARAMQKSRDAHLGPVSPDSGGEARVVVAPAQLAEAISLSAKAFGLWSKKPDADRCATLTKAVLAAVGKISEFGVVRNNAQIKEKLSDILSGFRSLISDKRGPVEFKQVEYIGPKGQTVVLLDSTVSELTPHLLLMVTTALMFGNAMVIVCSDRAVQEALVQLQTCMEGAGVDKGTLAVLLGDSFATVATQLAKSRQLDLVLTYGVANQQAEMLLGSEQIPFVVSRQPLNTYSCEKLFRDWVDVFRKVKTVHFASGDIFAN